MQKGLQFRKSRDSSVIGIILLLTTSPTVLAASLRIIGFSATNMLQVSGFYCNFSLQMPMM